MNIVQNSFGFPVYSHASIREWNPSVGDIIIKNGWITRTEWFGVVNGVSKTGEIEIKKAGNIQLLITDNQIIKMNVQKIKINTFSTYCVIKPFEGLYTLYI